MSTDSWDAVFLANTRVVVQQILVPTVVVFGIFGNVVTISVLTRRQMRVSSNVYLTALAVSDMVFLLLTFSLSWKHYDLMKHVQLYWVYVPFGLWVTDAASSSSVWITVAFTVERCIAVRHPIWVKTPCSERRAFYICVAVAILCLLFTCTTPFEWKVSRENGTFSLVSEHTHKGNRTNLNSVISDSENNYTLVCTEFGTSTLYRLVFYWFTTITFVFVPLAVLFFANTLLVFGLRKSYKQRNVLTNNALQSNHHQEDRITLRLVAVSVFFLVCQTPAAVVLIYTAIHTVKPDSAEHNVLLGLGNVFNFLLLVNAASNCIFYTALSTKYRKLVRDMFCGSQEVE